MVGRLYIDLEGRRDAVHGVLHLQAAGSDVAGGIGDITGDLDERPGSRIQGGDLQEDALRMLARPCYIGRSNAVHAEVRCGKGALVERLIEDDPYGSGVTLPGVRYRLIVIVEMVTGDGPIDRPVVYLVAV